MKYIYLMRHAKSDWTHEANSDYDRPLNHRGLTEAPKIGKELRHRNILPEIFLSSPANRARTTAQLVAGAADFASDIVYLEHFYLGDIPKILDTLHQLPNAFNSVLLVGHNPVWEQLVTLFTSEHNHVVMNTSTIAALQCDANQWKDVYEGSCLLNWTLYAKDL